MILFFEITKELCEWDFIYTHRDKKKWRAREKDRGEGGGINALGRIYTFKVLGDLTYVTHSI